MDKVTNIICSFAKESKVNDDIAQEDKVGHEQLFVQTSVGSCPKDLSY